MRPEGAQVELCRERCVPKVLKLSSEVSECKPLAGGGGHPGGAQGPGVLQKQSDGVHIRPGAGNAALYQRVPGLARRLTQRHHRRDSVMVRHCQPTRVTRRLSLHLITRPRPAVSNCRLTRRKNTLPVLS